MTVSVDWATKLITVPQSDLTFVSGVLYELDTNWLRLQLKDLEDDEDGMPWPDTHRHSTEVTISGVTYARFLEVINGYTLKFTPNDPYHVRLSGSNNNLLDVLDPSHHHYSLIVQNSAGLIVVATGGGPTPGQIADAVWNETIGDHAGAGSAGLELQAKTEPADIPTADEVATEVWDLGDGIEVALTPRQAMRLIAAANAGKLSGAAGTTIHIRSVGDAKERITATVDADGNRTAVTVDGA